MSDHCPGDDCPLHGDAFAETPDWRALADDLWTAHTRLYHAVDVTNDQVADFHAVEVRYREARQQ